MQRIEIMPGTPFTGEPTFTVVPGEREFQPLEGVVLVSNGEDVGFGLIQSFGHNRLKDHTEINFRAVGSLVVEDVTEEEAAAFKATFMLDQVRPEPDQQGE